MTKYRVLLDKYKLSFEWYIESLNNTYCDFCRIYLIPIHDSIYANLSCFHIVIYHSDVSEYKVAQPYFDKILDDYVEITLIKFPKATYERSDVIRWIESYVLSDAGLTMILKHGCWIKDTLSSSEISQILHDTAIGIDNDSI